MSHPDVLAKQALLYGVETAPEKSCRVLELGCGDGSNLIPMAFGLPGCQFTGIDLAGAAGEHGLQFLAEADFTEIQDRHLPPEAHEKLRALAPDRVLREQYLDFLRGRRFRQTLLCRAGPPWIAVTPRARPRWRF